MSFHVGLFFQYFDWHLFCAGHWLPCLHLWISSWHLNAESYFSYHHFLLLVLQCQKKGIHFDVFLEKGKNILFHSRPLLFAFFSSFDFQSFIFVSRIMDFIRCHNNGWIFVCAFFILSGLFTVFHSTVFPCFFLVLLKHREMFESFWLLLQKTLLKINLAFLLSWEKW